MLGKPAKFRWFWNGEAGATIFTSNAKVPAFTLGLGMGWEWTLPQKEWAISAQPTLRGMFWSSEDTYADYLVLGFELGIRHPLGSRNERQNILNKSGDKQNK